MNTALVIGATGLVGSHLVQELLNSTNYESIVVLVRRSIFSAHPKLTEKEFDFNNLISFENLELADHVFCCLGTTIKTAGSKTAFKFVDYELPLRFAKWSEKSNVKSFSIVTAMGANSNSLFFYNRVKGDLEVDIKQLQIPKIQIFQPSLIMGRRMEFRFGELIGKWIMTFLNPFMLGPLRKYRGIHAKTIAKGMIHHLSNKGDGIDVFASDQIGELA